MSLCLGHFIGPAMVMKKALGGYGRKKWKRWRRVRRRRRRRRRRKRRRFVG
jgi:hypothetical protein